MGGGGIYINASFPLQIDDVWMFFDILEQKSIFAGYRPHTGRFNPLSYMDLNLLMQLSSSPKLFFFFNAIVFVIMAYMLYILALQFLNGFWAFLGIMIVFFNVGFITIITGICFPEKLQMFWLTFFVFALFFGIRKNSLTLILISLLCGIISLFYKETDFIFITIFSGVYLILSLWHKPILRNTKILIFGLLCGAGAFILIYLVITVPQTTSYAKVMAAQGFMLLQSILNAFLNHPFIFIFLPTLLIYRIRCYYQDRILYPLYDSLLLGALGYGFSFFVLQLFSVYYFMPCYVMGFLPAIFFAKKYFFKLKVVLIVCGILHCMINIPLALSIYTQTKILPPHYLKAMEFMAAHTKNSANSTSPNIFLLGQNRNADGLWLYKRAAMFLEHFGADNFNLKTNKPNPLNVALSDRTSPFSIFNSLDVEQPKSGDLLYLDCFSQDFITQDYIRTLNEKYTLIYHSAYFGFYNLNIKTLLKYLISKTSIYEAYLSQNERISSNIFGSPLGVYIYKVP